MQRLDMGTEAVTHDCDQLLVYLVLVLLVVLQSQESSGPVCVEGDLLTRLSLSNSTSMTACFWLRWRRNVSRMYGTSEITIDNDCDARASIPRIQKEVNYSPQEHRG